MQKRFYEIDALRFLAASAVMLMHYMLRGFSKNDNFSPVFFGAAGVWTRYNYLAVDLFFMISGFVILMSSEHGKAVRFVESRFLRLYPAYWLCCTLSFALTYVFINHIFHQSVSRYLLNLSMLQGLFGIGDIDFVYWTLLVEMKFYFLIFIVLLMKRIHNIESLLALWLALAYAQVGLHNAFIERYLITNYASFFIAGCALYRISKLGFAPLRGLLVLSSLPLGIFYEMQGLAQKAEHYGIAFEGLTVALICTSFYAIFLLLILRPSDNGGLKKVSVALGRISYPLYLVHPGVGFVVFNLVADRINKWALLGLVCTSMVLLAYLINVLIEKPLSAWLRQRLFSERSRGVAALAEGAP
ncbi:MAG: hypothetical protein JWL63_619 [Rhodocyclales bacterium]|nr:hypothetical protein [Rhodocyclales bacterium]